MWWCGRIDNSKECECGELEDICCTVSGAYLEWTVLIKPLPDDCLDAFQVPNDLVAFEQRMRGLESRVLEARRKNMAELKKVGLTGDDEEGNDDMILGWRKRL